MTHLPKRHIKLHEYQGQELFGKYQISIPRVSFIDHQGFVANTGTEAYEAALKLKALGSPKFVVKAQVHGGGRGRGHFIKSKLQGGVHVVDKAERVREIASQMCGDHLHTIQSGEGGFPCNKVYIAETVNIEKEVYLAFTHDRKHHCVTFIYSPEGGMAIEDVAHDTPEKIF